MIQQFAVLMAVILLQQPRARPGIDVLLADSAHLIAGKRIGLITNQSGIDARGVSTIDRLAHTTGHRLVALFAPEHGIRGMLSPGQRVSDAIDSATGLPIYSLYGANRAPTPAQMDGLDVLVVDLQDVGTRTWTYVSTTLEAMRAAKTAGKRIIVLDRPNPIGCAMQGPVLDTAYRSFIGPLPVPLRHGLTMGELMRFGNDVLAIHADLVVVPVQGWRRCQWFDETGLPWVRPSPNLPTLESVAWYPGTVLFEATNLSVGRGTDLPFRQVGAPWLQFSGHRDLPTVEFTPHSPGDGKYDNVRCFGIGFPVYDRRSGDPISRAVQMLALIEQQNPDSLLIDARGLAMRLGRAWTRPVPYQAWRTSEIKAFRRRVGRYLLYR